MKTIVDYFIQTASQYPDRVAVCDCEGSLTYQELDMRSNAIAHKLGTPYVLLLLPRRNNFLVAAYGAMKAGSCYVVASPDYPTDRISHIVNDSEAEIIVTTEAIWKNRQEELTPMFPPQTTVILIDQLRWDEEDCTPINNCTPDKEAFVLYTSGTTGKPKGVVHTIEGFTDIASVWVDSALKLGRPVHDGVIADFCFMASPLTIFPATETGGTCYIASEEQRMDMERLAAFLADNHIDRVFMSGTMGKAMLSQYDLHFEMLLLGGERFPSIDAELLEKNNVYNLYGMTEGVPMGMYRVTGNETVVPVGKTQTAEDLIYVLDPQGQPVAEGQTGEIFFSSRKMAKCYKNLPEQTAERFVADPWRPGFRMVRTSDLGYIDEDGNLVHCGRADNMFKINGFRVEPGEVENVAQACPGITTCACVKKELATGDALCLYFEATSTIDTEALRAFMAAKLAHYMVPEFIVQLDELPRNARGKIDRKAMPDPLRETTTQMIAPVNAAERTLFEIVSKLLDTNQFGVTDNLFALGLTSILAMKMAAEATRKGVLVKATDIIRLKTIRKVLQDQMTMMRWFGDYNPTRKTAVFTHGISITSDIQEKLKILSRRYNVFTVEPIHEHYHYIFENEPMEEVIEFYYALMEVYMPADAQIAVFAGSSYGGKLAYLMASKHYESTGQKAAVILGDSLLRIGPMMGAIYKAGKLEEYQKAHHLPPIAEEMRERMFTTFEIDFYGENIPPYDGLVILLHALKSQSPIDNAGLWKEKASNLHIIPIDFTHNEICVDNPETLPYWEEGVELIEQS